MIDKDVECLEMLSSGYMIKYTMVFNLIKRSNYGKGSDAFNKLLEYEGNFCYIPTGKACFRKCLEYFLKEIFQANTINLYKILIDEKRS